MSKSGSDARVTTSGPDTIAIGIGRNDKVAGNVGCWLVLADWRIIDNRWAMGKVKCIKVDGKTIGANVLYELKGGKFTETERGEENEK